MAQVCTHESSEWRTETKSAAVLPPALPRGDLVVSRTLVGGATHRIDNKLSQEPWIESDGAGRALIVMIGTTPREEDEIALDLCDEGWQVVERPLNLLRNSLQPQAADEESSDSQPLINCLLQVVSRRLNGTLHATALTVARPLLVEPQTSAPGGNQLLSFARLTIDYSRRQIAFDGRAIALSKSEFELIYLLAQQPGRVFTRRELVAHRKGAEPAVNDRSIDVHIAGIRRKLGPAREHLETVRGYGYRFNATGSNSSQ